MIVNRAPVLTLWTVVVAEVLGFEDDEALTLGRAVAGVNAKSLHSPIWRKAPMSSTSKTDLRFIVGGRT
jgi:hypothetical protein